MAKKSFILLLFCLFTITATNADPFDDARMRWRDLLTGGNFQTDEPQIKIKVENITTTALRYWKTGFNREAGRMLLWNDLDYSKSSHISDSYARLNVMALAYCTKSSALYQNDTLRNDIINAMDWLSEKKYNTTVPLPDGSKPRHIDNWWDYKIGIPLSLKNIVVLLYDELGQARRERDMAAIGHFIPDLMDNGFTNGKIIPFTAANRVWICTILAVRAVILKDEKQLLYAQKELSPVFAYVTEGDGFYHDGSFIQHDGTPYTGGYGLSLMDNLSLILYFLGGSPWEIKDPGLQNIYAWIFDSFEPIVSPSGIMGMVTGREISRGRSAVDIGIKRIVDPILLLSEIARPAEAQKLKNLLKNWLVTYTALDYKSFLGIFNYGIAMKIVNDQGIHFAHHPFYKQFPNMDRVVISRPNYTFGVSMHSDRTYNYESINNENLKGWHTGDGMTYLYNGDTTQFEGLFWPTVDYYRLPGTTVEEQTTIPPVQTGNSDWVGGTGLDHLYGVTGMDLSPKGQSLEAKKSWFMFDNEIVALGAGIINGDQKNVQTYIEQRKLDINNKNEFSVNGVKLPATGSSSGQTLNMPVKWAYLSGTFPNSAIGYYFPGTARINILRRKQSGRWKEINTTVLGDTVLKTNTYLTLWYDHGIHPTDRNEAANKYAYVLLPGTSEQEVKNYNENPDVVILANSSSVQAVEERKLKIIAANFWKDGPSSIRKNGGVYITCDKKASLMLKETDRDYTIALADPTMHNNSTIELYIKINAGSIVAKDPGMEIIPSGTGLRIKANVKGLKGQTLTVKIAKKRL